jgi:hypothetical protein
MSMVRKKIHPKNVIIILDDLHVKEFSELKGIKNITVLFSRDFIFPQNEMGCLPIECNNLTIDITGIK